MRGEALLIARDDPVEPGARLRVRKDAQVDSAQIIQGKVITVLEVWADHVVVWVDSEEHRWSLKREHLELPSPRSLPTRRR